MWNYESMHDWNNDSENSNNQSQNIYPLLSE